MVSNEKPTVPIEPKQELTHMIILEQNLYIETLHNIHERDVIKCFDLESYSEARLTLNLNNIINF